MKVGIQEEREFKPVQLIITLESQEEFDSIKTFTGNTSLSAMGRFGKEIMNGCEEQKDALRHARHFFNMSETSTIRWMGMNASSCEETENKL